MRVKTLSNVQIQSIEVSNHGNIQSIVSEHLIKPGMRLQLRIVDRCYDDFSRKKLVDLVFLPEPVFDQKMLDTMNCIRNWLYESFPTKTFDVTQCYAGDNMILIDHEDLQYPITIQRICIGDHDRHVLRTGMRFADPEYFGDAKHHRNYTYIECKTFEMLEYEIIEMVKRRITSGQNAMRRHQKEGIVNV